MQLVVVNLLDMIARLGREEVEAFLHTFSCPLNVEVESFLWNKAIDFSLQKISVTHLVFNEKKNWLLILPYRLNLFVSVVIF